MISNRETVVSHIPLNDFLNKIYNNSVLLIVVTYINYIKEHYSPLLGWANANITMVEMEETMKMCILSLSVSMKVSNLGSVSLQ